VRPGLGARIGYRDQPLKGWNMDPYIKLGGGPRADQWGIKVSCDNSTGSLESVM
jgi:hypothetical protein